jgi:hypothetical protein
VNLTVAHLVKKFCASRGTKPSLLPSQVSATGPTLIQMNLDHNFPIVRQKYGRRIFKKKVTKKNLDRK